jgi:alkylation response protein AidB-like acyl-CoA dehydrogenase
VFHRELRYCEVSHTTEQEMLSDLVGGFMLEHDAIVLAKGAATGFDEHLWEQFLKLGLVQMALPSESGGEGGTLADVCVVAEQCGRCLAPIPYIETVVSARLAVAAGADALVGEVLAHNMLTTFAPTPSEGGRALVPAGALAGGVIGLVRDELVLAVRKSTQPPVENLGDSPLAWWSLDEDLDDRTVLATGDRARTLMATARREWKLATASLLLGLASGALEDAVQYAKSREAFGVPVGYFQSVSHPLVDVAIAIDGLSSLVRKAAWFHQEEPEHRRDLIDMAMVHATETANFAATAAVHTLGGVGFTVEADAHLYFTRAKGWSLLAGTVGEGLSEIADALYGAPAR